MSHEKVPRVVKGSKIVVPLRFRFRDTHNIFPLTGATITVKFPNQDKTCLSVAGTITDAANGLATATITAAQSALLLANPTYDFDAEVTIAGDLTIFVFLNALNVEERVCS